MIALVFRRMEWKHIEAIVTSDREIVVKNIVNDSIERLGSLLWCFIPFIELFFCAEFDERIIKASLNWGHLVVVTSARCFVYRYIDYSV